MSTTPQRMITSYYQDPLEMIWLHALHQMQWTLQRSSDVFASWDGRQTLTLGHANELDPDDHLAQMVLHEVCHACIEGPSAWSQVDWGLSNFDAHDLDREYACHHLQAYLADQVNLRIFFGPTTQWRAYYMKLGPDPLATGDIHLLKLAQKGLKTFHQSPWFNPIMQALKSTEAIHNLLNTTLNPSFKSTSLCLWLHSEQDPDER